MEDIQVVVKNVFIYDLFFYTYIIFIGTSDTANWHYLPLILILHDMIYFLMRKVVGNNTDLVRGAFFAWYMHWSEFLLIEALPWYVINWYFPVGFKTYIALQIYNITRFIHKPISYTSPYDLLVYVF